MNVGVILCDCGGQISQQIDTNALKDRISSLGDVVWFETIGLVCADDTKEYLISLIKRQPVDGLIILGCSPRFKGQYLEDILKEAGLNPYLINIVNIREQVIWVTDDKTEATKKIYALFLGALKRLRHQRPLKEREISICPDVLVVGAGIAGITAALTLSNLGRKVFLLDRERYLGGRISRFETLFPNLECAPCLVHPLIDEVINSKTIDLLSNAQVLSIKGGLGNLFVKVLLNPNYINPKRCIGCFACVDVCPVGCISIDPKRQPVIAEIDETRCIRIKGDECNFCRETCPVEGTIDFEATRSEIQLHVGSILWATGFNIFDCTSIDNLGYGRLPNIYTAMEFEDILHSEGATKGQIFTKKGKKPRRVLIIHCVGSLEDEYVSHCSKICCQYAFKFNRLIRQRLPNASITHLIKELVLPGIKADKLYLESKKDKNVHFLRFKSIKDIWIKQKGQRLLINVKKDIFVADIVVLCPAMMSGEVLQDEVSGIIKCGSIKEPMSFEETKTDALAEVSNLLLLLKYDDKIKKSLHFARLDYNRCSRCGICLNQCPYGAIELMETGTIDISDVLCEGCGLCAVSCPSRAIDLEGFTDKQITSEIQGIIEGLEEGKNWQ
ncbi:MAG: 4Fe-4S binding protein [Thermodesulfovibrionales bacterium]|nr:4Fe-4S binding protein [Thermodesulfovibrionales bacterium]